MGGSNSKGVNGLPARLRGSAKFSRLIDYTMSASEKAEEDAIRKVVVVDFSTTARRQTIDPKHRNWR